ncbi:hypothetical protein FN846DRAFT_923268 [Sphaerosporella brunnea]|uniref:Uncharacterized protein n=1 Tax=Sphaerosporella brunnea TaxID=1250544 RepID=A0A5J5EEJ4_9PEZI|nr:hypothetical protein FN846DRAFT_923268 [Sphaerosporella brunnea]
MPETGHPANEDRAAVSLNISVAGDDGQLQTDTPSSCGEANRDECASGSESVKPKPSLSRSAPSWSSGGGPFQLGYDEMARYDALAQIVDSFAIILGFDKVSAYKLYPNQPRRGAAHLANWLLTNEKALTLSYTQLDEARFLGLCRVFDRDQIVDILFYDATVQVCIDALEWGFRTRFIGVEFLADVFAWMLGVDHYSKAPAAVRTRLLVEYVKEERKSRPQCAEFFAVLSRYEAGMIRFACEIWAALVASVEKDS